MTTSHPTFSPTLTHPTSFHLSTGHSLYTHLLPQLLRTTQHSLILVTCFWASSPTSHLLSSFLRQLSAKATTSADPSSKIHIRICVSSLSALQKAFHTSSPHGTLLTPETLGLPPPDEIPGVDLRIKSIFLRPCHVLHGKYIIQDGQSVWFPSANVSWEDWGEGCIGFENGDGEGKESGLAGDLLRYWEGIWDSDGTMSISDQAQPSSVPSHSRPSPLKPAPSFSRTHLLPHPHSPYNPLHIFLPSILFPSSNTTPPPTPLNTFLLTHVSTASHSLQIYTPNLTYRPLITALEDALERGVNIRIVLPKKMMVFEQLLTAGTLSEIEVWRLQRRISKLAARRDEEMGRIGGLEVVWFDAQAVRATDEEERNVGRPLKLHLKLTIIDDSITVLGSGNMDRASWVTSQEVGVAVFSEEVAKRVVEVVRRVYG
ncbi:Phospholipase D Transphosphatidylase protein [Rutstroemia sp. NJR-2017a WRK4]|nr:Phospholipase D Transphosphatidylase protein [Rutstroemia sp. NJR-2017a WRK4]